jgi:hypothetical protein
MAHFAPYLVGGLTAFLAMDYVPPATKHLTSVSAPWLSASQAAPSTQADRSGKGDRVAVARPAGDAKEITAVEVVGLRGAAIVYRDRDGRELFRTDRVSNVTIVSKGVTLPELTVREHASSTIKPVPVEVRDQARDGGKSPAPRRKVPLGCEPSFSPVAAPSMAHHTGRCMAEIEAPTQVAQLIR